MKLRDRIKELRRVKASDILPNPANWRTHPKAQQDAMRGILAEVGIADALLVRETPAGLQLIDGHLRADVSPDSEWPVLVLDVDDKEAAKLLATFDPLSAMAETDPEKLRELLRQIDVDSEALQQMLAELADEAGLQDDGVEIIEDEVPAPPDEATTQPGDLWILGNHRLLCGDSSKPEDVDRLLDGAVIHLVNTDPPYNVKVEPRSNNAIAAGLSSFAGPKHHQSLDLARHPEKSKPTGKKLRAKDRPLANDFVTDAAFDELLARLRALTRRGRTRQLTTSLSYGPIVLDTTTHLVTVAARPVELSATEYRLLEALLESQGRVLSRGQLIDRVWGSASEVDERTVDVHVGRLRKALVRGNERREVRADRFNFRQFGHGRRIAD